MYKHDGRMGAERKEKKPKDPNLSSVPTREYVRAIAMALNIKLERKLMKKDYCQQFIYDHKIEYYKYIQDNNIEPHPTQKQIRYIDKMKKVLEHYFKDSEVYTDYSTMKKAGEYIEKWAPIYHSHVSSYYNQ